MRQSKKQKQLREFIGQSKATVHTPAKARELKQKALDKSGENDIIKSVGNVEFLLVTPENSSPKTDVGSSAFSNEVLERLKTVENLFFDEYERLGKKYRDIAAQNGTSIVRYLRNIEEETIDFLAKKYGLNF